MPGSDSDGNGSLTPLICFGQFASDPHAGRGLPLDPNFSQMFKELWMFLSSGTTLPCRPPLLLDPPTLHAPGN